MLTIISREALPAELSLSSCKNYLRIFDASHDSTITLMRDAALRAIENYTRQRFQTVTVEQSFLDNALSQLTLSAFPIVSIDSITVDGTPIGSPELQSIKAPWQASPSAIESQQTPFLGDTVVRYTCGWVDWPADLLLLVLEKLGESFENRKATGPAVTNQFTRAHSLVLENYASYYDAIR